MNIEQLKKAGKLFKFINTYYSYINYKKYNDMKNFKKAIDIICIGEVLIDFFAVQSRFSLPKMKYVLIFGAVIWMNKEVI